ncbi:2OG-Fe dioxygenase family protein [Streptomyces sp. NPDC003077]|uniref:2OG-Fe dioxygenase family protein n=1 Tax=Streptomyces sp. NPDC003077 TaxID=3154443 RepID=UPI0033A125AE
MDDTTARTGPVPAAGAETAEAGVGPAPPTGPIPPPAPVEAAMRALVTTKAHLMRGADLRESLGAGDDRWRAFAAHWEELSPDRYAAERGTRRLRRYGQFSLDAVTGEISPLSHVAFVQPENTNYLYEGVDREFEPLTDAFVRDPLFRAVMALLGRIGAVLDSTPTWTAKVHPFRVVASPDGEGDPTPEGRHRDGVTLVSSLLIDRRNVAGGESSVTTPEGRRLLGATLSEPGDLLLGDDRLTLHEVTPVRPVDPAQPAYRDVLVTTLTVSS